MTHLETHLPLLIGGRRVDGPRRLDVMNPARPDERVGTVVRADPGDVAAAIDAARRAQRGWGALSFAQRAAALATALDRLDEGLDARATLFVRENGKILADARGELAGVAARGRLALELAPALDAGRRLESPGGSSTSVRYRPFGVVVSIVPWNAPVSLAFSQIVAALLTGNAVVVKPPETCPLALTLTVELFAAALPAGLLNAVTGLPGEIGDALTRDEAVGKIAFTGSVRAARSIMANAAEGIRSVTLELGGNDPAIVLPDADLSEASLTRMGRAVFRMTGQVCMAVKRIYVPDDMLDAFVDAFGAVADRMVVGDGLLPAVTMGPLHTRAALERAEALVDDARRTGADVRVLGRMDDSAAGGGHFMRPIVVTGLPDEAPLMRDEQFCPAIPVSPYRDVDDAIARANASPYGLGGSVWGRDLDRATCFARRLEAGTVFVNTHGTEAIDRRAPYGGSKQSGIGRKSGLEGLLDYTESQTLTVFG